MQLEQRQYSVKSLLAVVFIMISAVSVMSQQTSLMFARSNGLDGESRMEQYAEELVPYDLTIGVPEGFHGIDMRGRQYINTNISKNWQTSGMQLTGLPVVALEADNDEAVFLYPTCVFPDPNAASELMVQMVRSASQIESELRYSRGDMKLDVRPLIEIVSGDNMSDYANADTVVIYSFDFKRPFLDRYNHCIGIYLRKYAHTPLLLKIALTKEGLPNKDKYIRQLLGSISYGDNPNPALVKSENLKGEELDFPSVYVEKVGIVSAN